MKFFSKNNSSNGRQNTPAGNMKTMDLVITNRVSVPAAFYEEVKAKVILSLPFLDRLDSIVPEDLVGPYFWCGLDDRQQRQVKACIAHMVHTRALPISPRETWLEAAHFYVLG
jgi:hypothetical protein